MKNDVQMILSHMKGFGIDFYFCDFRSNTSRFFICIVGGKSQIEMIKKVGSNKLRWKKRIEYKYYCHKYFSIEYLSSSFCLVCTQHFHSSENRSNVKKC